MKQENEGEGEGKMKSVTIKGLDGQKLIKIKRNKAGDGYDVDTLSSMVDMDVVIVDDKGRCTIPVRRKK